MPDWLISGIDVYAANPVIQVVLIALATFILEDPVTIGSGLLVAEGIISFPVAFIGLWVGIALGDIGLYIIGRFFSDAAVRWNWIKNHRIETGKKWFNKNIVTAILVSRFVPGLRLPTYVGAGMAKASVAKFLVTAVSATLIWTIALLYLTISFEQAVVPLVGELKWIFLGLLLLIIIVVNIFVARNSKRKQVSSKKQIVSSFEFLHPAIFYIPVGFYYLFLSIRHGGFTIPTVSNPSIYSGGMIGESKSQILSLIPTERREWVADYVKLGASQNGKPLSRRLDEAEAAMAQSGIGYPVVAKPDEGQRGDGVRPLENRNDLQNYISEFPNDNDLLLQSLIQYPGEAGVFWYRYPDESEGEIFSLTLKYFPTVVGDGRSTLKELIESDGRAKLLKRVYFKRHQQMLETVIPTGNKFKLVFSGNHCQGAIFKNGNDKITQELRRRINEIALSMPGFYFGRFDLRFQDIASLQNGEKFKILEVNGASAEATHIWDAKTTLSEAYNTLFKQFKILFEIGVANKRKGFKPVGIIRFLGDFFSYRKQSKHYPLSY